MPRKRAAPAPPAAGTGRNAKQAKASGKQKGETGRRDVSEIFADYERWLREEAGCKWDAQEIELCSGSHSVLRMAHRITYIADVRILSRHRWPHRERWRRLRKAPHRRRSAPTARAASCMPTEVTSRLTSARVASVGKTLVRIPKRACLCWRTSALPAALSRAKASLARAAAAPKADEAAPELPDSVKLNLCLMHEIGLGARSKWAAYLAAMPAFEPGVPLLWPASDLVRASLPRCSLSRKNLWR